MGYYGAPRQVQTAAGVGQPLRAGPAVFINLFWYSLIVACFFFLFCVRRFVVGLWFGLGFELGGPRCGGVRSGACQSCFFHLCVS